MMGDETLLVFQRVFGDLVDPEVWSALVRDDRPVEEIIDGPLAGLVDDMFAALAEPAVMKFAPGLRPVLKHQSGKHDQKTHGRRAGAGQLAFEGMAPGGGDFSAWGDRARELKFAARTGPSAELLREALYGKDPASITDEEIRDFLAQQYQMPLRAYDGEERERQLDELVLDYSEYARGELATREAKEQIQEAYGAFDEVYGRHHVGINSNGDVVTIDSSVESIYAGYGTVTVEGALTNGDGRSIGSFKRVFGRDGNGGIYVEHEWLEIADESHQGTGFSKAFNKTAENYYISHGVDTVKVHAGLSVGGYTWAAAGFDFDQSNMGHNINEVAGRISWKILNDTSMPAPVRTEAQSIVDRLSLSWSDPDFPTPKEIADIGRLPGADWWPGKDVMLGSNWYGQKQLVPEGSRKSSTQKWKEDRAKAREEAKARIDPNQLTLDRDIADASIGQGTLFPAEPSTATQTQDILNLLEPTFTTGG